MFRKTINCPSCETLTDIIIRSSNYEEESILEFFCPVCTTPYFEIEKAIGYEDDEDDDEDEDTWITEY